MTAAFFETVTKIVDGTRKVPLPESCYVMMAYMLWIVQVVYDALNFFASKLPLK